MLRIIILSIFFSLPVFANTPEFISLKKPFQIFINKAKNADFDTQLELWKTTVEASLPDVYSDLFQGSDGDLRRKKLATKWFPFIVQHSESILLQFESFEKSSWPIARKLAERNPSVDFSDVRVIAMPSLMMFDGMVTTPNGRLVALFGMDFFEMVTVNPKIIAGADLITNPSVIVAHEFTHVLHAKSF